MIKFKDDITLIELLNCFPGLYNIDQRYEKNRFFMVFYVKDTQEGLFLLTRTTDRRYCRYGDFWNLNLSVGDTMIDDERPICYVLDLDLNSNLHLNLDIKEIIDDLIENIIHHLNHSNFTSYFKIDPMIFYNKYLSNERIRKIETIRLHNSLKNINLLTYL